MWRYVRRPRANGHRGRVHRWLVIELRDRFANGGGGTDDVSEADRNGVAHRGPDRDANRSLGPPDGGDFHAVRHCDFQRDGFADCHRITDPNRHLDADGHCDADTHGNPDADVNAHGYSDPNPHRDADTDGYRIADRHVYLDEHVGPGDWPGLVRVALDGVVVGGRFGRRGSGATNRSDDLSSSRLASP